MKLLRMRQVLEQTGLSRSVLYRLVDDGSFPRPVKLGERSIAWRSEDVDAWIAARPPA
jgi:prophage regulatory protein